MILANAPRHLFFVNRNKPNKNSQFPNSHYYNQLTHNPSVLVHLSIFAQECFLCQTIHQFLMGKLRILFCQVLFLFVQANKGQLLLSLNTSITESSIQEVKTGLELANKFYEKQEELWEQKIGSEMQYLEAKNAKEQSEARLVTLEAQLDMARVKAPFSGVVETIMLKEGELAAPGMQVIQMVSLNNLKLYGNISARYMTSIKKGEMVIVTFPDVEGLNVEVPIHRVGNVIDNASRTFRIEMKINNRQKKLKPNMYSTIQVNDFKTASTFVVPSVAIKQDIKGNYLYVASREEGEIKARKRYIETGLSFKDQTMIREGVSQGEEVIVKGFAQVSDGVNISVK